MPTMSLSTYTMSVPASTGIIMKRIVLFNTTNSTVKATDALQLILSCKNCNIDSTLIKRANNVAVFGGPLSSLSTYLESVTVTVYVSDILTIELTDQYVGEMNVQSVVQRLAIDVDAPTYVAVTSSVATSDSIATSSSTSSSTSTLTSSSSSTSISTSISDSTSDSTSNSPKTVSSTVSSSLATSSSTSLATTGNYNSTDSFAIVEPSSSSNTIAIALGASLGGAFLICIVLAAFVLVRRKQRKNKPTEDIPMEKIATQYATLENTQNSTGYSSIPPMRSATVTIPSAPITRKTNWEIPYHELIIGKLVGSGAYGEVFQGSWRNVTVAIKQLKDKTISEARIKEFIEEVEIYKNLRPHPNTVPFYGACTSFSTPICLVTEFLHMGSLNNYLASHPNIPRKTKLDIIKGAASGINHLHQEKIVHRDIAARNVLLQNSDSKLIAKISDFGLSRFTEQHDSQQTKSEVGPLKWMSVEALTNRVYSTKSDVWSFGVLCYEIINQHDPFPDMDAFNAGSRVAYQGLRLELPNEKEWPVLHKVMAMCFMTEPEKRPDMQTICTLLEEESV